MLVSHFLSRSAARRPGKTALVFEGRRLTYRDVYQRARSVAAFLLRRGIERGDRVAVYLGNRPETVFSLFGALEAGGCFVVINPTVKQAKLRQILENSEARFLITSRDRQPLVERAFSELAAPPEAIFCGAGEPDHLEEILETPAAASAAAEPIDADLAAIIYTSGSTGDPKGVTMTHRNMVAAATSITAYLENVEEDVILDVLPLSFDYGLYQLLMAFKIGGTLVLERGFGFPYDIIELIQRERVTGFPGVPTLFSILLRMEERHDLSSVRYVTNTAAALPPAFLPGLARLFPNARIYSMYGLTECKRVSYLPPDRIDDKPDSVGIPMPNTEVWIVDDDNNVLPPGEVGELVVRGASVMQGFFNDPSGTERVLRPGRYPWERVLHTGDLFRMDEEGFLYFVGRKDDLIKSRGERVAPKEVENVLYALEEVVRARVTGVRHDTFGQAIKAEIVVKQGCSLDPRRVKDFCRQHLEDLMVPHFVEIVDDLPLSPSGKVKRCS